MITPQLSNYSEGSVAAPYRPIGFTAAEIAEISYNTKEWTITANLVGKNAANAIIGTLSRSMVGKAGETWVNTEAAPGSPAIAGYDSRENMVRLNEVYRQKTFSGSPTQSLLFYFWRTAVSTSMQKIGSLYYPSIEIVASGVIPGFGQTCSSLSSLSGGFLESGIVATFLGKPLAIYADHPGTLTAVSGTIVIERTPWLI